MEKWKTFLVLSLVVFSLYGFSGALGELNQRLAGIREYYGRKVAFDGDKITVEKQGWRFVLTPVEGYEVSGGVVGKKSYRWGDPGHLVSPMDVAIAWGDLISPEYKEDIEYSMGEREYFFTYYPREAAQKLTAEYITTHSSNNHIVPANEEILEIVKDLEIGDMVTLSGRLVDVNGRNAEGEKFEVKTSRSRSDSGPGSCEVIFLEDISISN